LRSYSTFLLCSWTTLIEIAVYNIGFAFVYTVFNICLFMALPVTVTFNIYKHKIYVCF
jgi:hypothetical protein